MQLRNFVNGEYVDSAAGHRAEVIDPTRPPVRRTGRHRCPTRGRRPRDEGRRQRLPDLGRDHPPAERQLALLKLADALEKRASDFVDTEVQNTGKPRALTLSEEIPPAVDALRFFFAGAARVLEGRAAGEYLAGHTSFIRREPIGVVAQVTPWNYPLLMAIWKIAPALAAGNTIVLKPSDTTRRRAPCCWPRWLPNFSPPAY